MKTSQAIRIALKGFRGKSKQDTRSVEKWPRTKQPSDVSRVQSHEDAPDQTTAVAGVLSISSVEAAPTPAKRRTSRPAKQQ